MFFFVSVVSHLMCLCALCPFLCEQPTTCTPHFWLAVIHFDMSMLVIHINEVFGRELGYVQSDLHGVRLCVCAYACVRGCMRLSVCVCFITSHTNKQQRRLTSIYSNTS